MRPGIRSLLTVIGLLASCTAASPAFAEEGPATLTAAALTGFAAVDAAAQASQPAAPSAPAQDLTSEALTAVMTEDEKLAEYHRMIARGLSDTEARATLWPDPPDRVTTSALVDAWFAKHFHGLGPHLTEYLHGRLLAAVEELKALLLELPLS